jgi:tetratricopeptide (TPR) repeat protein
METDRRCPQCGEVIPWGQATCPLCAEHGSYLWSLRRDTFLVLTFLFLVLLFIATGLAAKFYHAKQNALAGEWFDRGEADLQASRAQAALDDFRNALAYSRDNALYRQRLAEALLVAGRVPEARAYLLTLWEQEPGSGTINLDLARLAVREGEVPEALRYYQNAIYGEWGSEAPQRRREVRLELAKFLLAAGERAEAQSDLIALAGDLPRDPKLLTQVGEFLQKTASYTQALQLFRQALSLSPHLASALDGAGECYFELANYLQAVRYLERALAVDPHLVQASERLKIALAVLSIDPFQPRLASQERSRRALRAFEQAMTRLRDCAAKRGVVLEASGGGTDLQKTYAQGIEQKPQVRQRLLARDPDLLQTTMDWVFEAERLAERSCGESQGVDLVLLLVARAQGGARP